MERALLKTAISLCVALLFALALVPAGVARAAKRGPDAAARSVGPRAAKVARRFLGVPYRWGGADPSGFDCSGLVAFVYRQLGVKLPRTSYELFHVGRPVGRSALRPGDLLFFHGGGHVGLYLGGRWFIHANRGGGSVRIASLRGWYGSALTGARRVAVAR